MTTTADRGQISARQALALRALIDFLEVHPGGHYRRQPNTMSRLERFALVERVSDPHGTLVWRPTMAGLAYFHLLGFG